MEENSYKKYLTLFIGLIALGLIYWHVSNPLTIAVTGSGLVTVPANSVSAQVTIVATGVDAGSSVSMLDTKITSVRDTMVAQGVDEENISQSQPQVTPAALIVSGASGYQASATIAFKTKNVTETTKLVTDLYSNGATVVSQPVYQVEDQAEAEQSAMKEAMQKADNEAKLFARSKWKLIKRIVAVQQATSGTSSQSAVKDVVGSGSIQIARAVQVTYKMW